MNDSPRSARFTTHAIIAVVIILVLAAAFSGLKRLRYKDFVDETTYQAVFFEPSNPYFGHLKGVNTRHPYLTDIYYVKVEPVTEGNATLPRFTLVKFGETELHGPQDSMYFSWDRVLFWENLRTDSEVVKAIAKEKAQKAAQATQPVQTAAPSAQ